MEQRTVVVTGARGGIGRAVVSRLSADGRSVAALDVTPPDPALSDVAQFTVAATDVPALDSALADIATSMPPILALVNVAGVVATGPLLSSTAAEFHRMFDVNAFGVWATSRAVLELMVEQCPDDPTNRRSIVTVASNAGHVPRAGMALYGASKAAATHLTRSLALEAARYGVRCNVVSPGTTRSPMTAAMWGETDGEAAALTGDVGLFRNPIPLRRIADPVDTAGVVSFLVGPDARHVTGQELVVDGGATQG